MARTVTIVETYSRSDAAHVGNHATLSSRSGKGADGHACHRRSERARRRRTFAVARISPWREGAKLRTLAIQAGSVLSRTTSIGTLRRARARMPTSPGSTSSAEGQHSRHHAGGEPRGAATPPASRCTSRSRAAARKAVFQGKIVVERDAQKTDAKLMMQGLMLSDEARDPLEARARDFRRRRGLRPRLDLRRARRDVAVLPDEPRHPAGRGRDACWSARFLAELIDPIEDEALHERARRA